MMKGWLDRDRLRYDEKQVDSPGPRDAIVISVGKKTKRSLKVKATLGESKDKTVNTPGLGLFQNKIKKNLHHTHDDT